MAAGADLSGWGRAAGVVPAGGLAVGRALRGEAGLAG